MSTESGETFTVDTLLAEPAAAPAQPAATEQPLPPDVVDTYQSQPVVQQPAAQTPPQVTQPAPEQPQPHMVPLSELIAERRERQEYAQKLRQLEDTVHRLTQPQQPQPQQSTIDPVEDPQGFVNAITQQIETRFLNQALNDSEARARGAHGNDVVDAAFQAARDAGMASAFTHKPDAYGEMVKWHQAQQLMATIGTNPTAYQEQLKAHIRAQVLAELKQGTPPPSNLSPSLSSAPKANNAPEVVSSGRDFFNSMMNQQRPR